MKNKKYYCYLFVYALILFVLPRVIVYSGLVNLNSNLLNTYLLWFQALLYILLGLGGVALFKDELKEQFEQISNRKSRLAVFTLTTYLVMLFINAVVMYAAQGLIEQSQNQMNVQQIISGGSSAVAFIIILFGPLTEELVFRHSLINLLDRKLPKFFSSAISVILFAAIHLSPGELTAIIPYLIIGSFVTYYYRKWDDNVIASFALHALNNLVAFTMISLFKDMLPM